MDPNEAPPSDAVRALRDRIDVRPALTATSNSREPLVIHRGSEAWESLARAMMDDRVDRVSLEIRRPASEPARLAAKYNAGMWTHSMSCEARS